MKEIIEELPLQTKVVTIKQMFAESGSNDIIAYVTSGNKGLGILCSFPDDTYGFVYHKHLVKYPFSDISLRQRVYFEATSKTQCIKNVLNAKRKLYVFENFMELLTFCVNNELQ